MIIGRKIVNMNNPSAGSSSKQRTGSSQPSETSFKRKRGVFQKECNYLSFSFCFLLQHEFVCENVIMCFSLFLVQHMMYGFGDDPNVSEVIIYCLCFNLYKKDDFVCFHGNSILKFSLWYFSGFFWSSLAVYLLLKSSVELRKLVDSCR